MKVWCNDDDTKRERPVLRGDGRWSLESWHRYRAGGFAETIVHGAGFATQQEVIEWIERFLEFSNPELVRVLDLDHMTQGWSEAAHWQAPEGSPEIEVGQIWERAGRAAIVLDYSPDPMTGMLSVLVRYAHPNPGQGSSMYRKPSAHWYTEQRFRKLYRP